MKKLFLSLSALFFLAGLISCKKDSADPQPEPFVPAFTQGDVFYSDIDGDIFWLHDPEGAATITKIHENLNKIVEDVLIDQKTNKIYIANYSDGKIYVADFKGGNITPVEFVSLQAKSLALWDRDGKRSIYAAVNLNQSLKEIDINTKNITDPDFVQVGEVVKAVAVDNVNGAIYVNQDDAGIRKKPLNGGLGAAFGGDINDGKIDINLADSRLFWIEDKFQGQLRSSSLNGNAIQSHVEAGNDDCESVSFDPVKKFVYYAKPNEGKLMRLRLVDNNVKEFNTTKIRAIAVVK